VAKPVLAYRGMPETLVSSVNSVTLLIMEPNETVLSDIHIDMSHTRSVDHAENSDNVKYAG